MKAVTLIQGQSLRFPLLAGRMLWFNLPENKTKPHLNFPKPAPKPGRGRSVDVSGPTPELQAQVVALIVASNHPDIACRKAGIKAAVLAKWRERAAKGEKLFTAFFDAIEHAEPASETKLVGVIDATAPENWRAAAALLGKRFPERWGEFQQPDAVNVMGLNVNIHLALPRGERAPGTALPPAQGFEPIDAEPVDFATVPADEPAPAVPAPAPPSPGPAEVFSAREASIDRQRAEEQAPPPKQASWTEQAARLHEEAVARAAGTDGKAPRSRPPFGISE